MTSQTSSASTAKGPLDLYLDQLFERSGDKIKVSRKAKERVYTAIRAMTEEDRKRLAKFTKAVLSDKPVSPTGADEALCKEQTIVLQLSSMQDKPKASRGFFEQVAHKVVLRVTKLFRMRESRSAAFNHLVALEKYRRSQDKDFSFAQHNIKKVEGLQKICGQLKNFILGGLSTPTDWTPQSRYIDSTKQRPVDSLEGIVRYLENIANSKNPIALQNVTDDRRHQVVMMFDQLYKVVKAHEHMFPKEAREHLLKSFGGFRDLMRGIDLKRLNDESTALDYANKLAEKITTQANAFRRAQDFLNEGEYGLGPDRNVQQQCINEMANTVKPAMNAFFADIQKAIGADLHAIRSSKTQVALHKQQLNQELLDNHDQFCTLVDAQGIAFNNATNTLPLLDAHIKGLHKALAELKPRAAKARQKIADLESKRALSPKQQVKMEKAQATLTFVEIQTRNLNAMLEGCTLLYTTETRKKFDINASEDAQPKLHLKSALLDHIDAGFNPPPLKWIGTTYGGDIEDLQKNLRKAVTSQGDLQKDFNNRRRAFEGIKAALFKWSNDYRAFLQSAVDANQSVSQVQGVFSEPTLRSLNPGETIPGPTYAQAMQKGQQEGNEEVMDLPLSTDSAQRYATYLARQNSVSQVQGVFSGPTLRSLNPGETIPGPTYAQAMQKRQQEGSEEVMDLPLPAGSAQRYATYLAQQNQAVQPLVHNKNKKGSASQPVNPFTRVIL